MTHHRWVITSLTDESLVADLLLRMKHSSDSFHAPSQPQRTESVLMKGLPPRWGNRKNRSKPASPVISGKEQRGSPNTHLSWSCGGSTSDDSSRPSHLSSVKANEIASTSDFNKSHKRKSFFELKDEEDSLNLNQQTSTNQNLNKIKINSGQNLRKATSSCRVEAEIKRQDIGFVLPDLNMTPNDEDLMMMMS